MPTSSGSSQQPLTGVRGTPAVYLLVVAHVPLASQTSQVNYAAKRVNRFGKSTSVGQAQITETPLRFVPFSFQRCPLRSSEAHPFDDGPPSRELCVRKTISGDLDIRFFTPRRIPRPRSQIQWLNPLLWGPTQNLCSQKNGQKPPSRSRQVD